MKYVLSFIFSYDGHTVKTASSSHYAHYRTSIGLLHNTPIVVGSNSYARGFSGHKKVEAFQNGKWTLLSDFPFEKTRLFDYSMVNFKNALYLFGLFIKFYYLLI